MPTVIIDHSDAILIAFRKMFCRGEQIVRVAGIAELHYDIEIGYPNGFDRYQVQLFNGVWTLYPPYGDDVPLGYDDQMTPELLADGYRTAVYG